MGQMNKISKNNTQVYDREDGGKQVFLHGTCVVEWGRDFIKLNSGGWPTTTTKSRMNQASSQYNLGYGVWAKNFKWFVTYAGEDLEFYDGITLQV